MANVICETVKLRKIYPMGDVEVTALAGVDVIIAPGEFTAFAGPSGSGKTTLLNMIGCLDAPTSGQVILEGAEVGALAERALERIRAKRIGFIFQSFNLIPVLTAYENVEVALRLAGGASAGGASAGDHEGRQEKVERALTSVGLSDHMHRRPSQLSGGQQQRVAIARALVKSPALVIADEPTANLDSVTAAGVMDLMREMNETLGATFLFSTHDAMVIDQARRVVKLRDGRIESDERST